MSKAAMGGVFPHTSSFGDLEAVDTSIHTIVQESTTTIEVYIEPQDLLPIVPAQPKTCHCRDPCWNDCVGIGT